MAPNPLALESPSRCSPSSPLPPVGSRGPSSLSPSCFQRLTAIQQVLKAQKISFLLRGGVRVLVAMRDTDTGKGLSPVGYGGRAAGFTGNALPVRTGDRGLFGAGWLPPGTTAQTQGPSSLCRGGTDLWLPSRRHLGLDLGLLPPPWDCPLQSHVQPFVFWARKFADAEDFPSALEIWCLLGNVAGSPHASQLVHRDVLSTF